ncbi:hypothetical protein DXT97_12170 [Agrobacterium tumefaciens]|nr:hypothetical protein [Agrobacterium tumefaciens]
MHRVNKVPKRTLEIGVFRRVEAVLQRAVGRGMIDKIANLIPVREGSAVLHHQRYKIVLSERLLSGSRLVQNDGSRTNGCASSPSPGADLQQIDKFVV